MQRRGNGGFNGLEKERSLTQAGAQPLRAMLLLRAIRSYGREKRKEGIKGRRISKREGEREGGRGGREGGNYQL
jgi:hypothetical protein